MELYAFFKSKYPSVYFASIMRDKGVSRGYGFVHLGNDEEYNRCLKEMDRIVFRNKILKVKEKNNICFRASNVFNNYFSDLKVKDIGAFYPKAMMFCDKKMIQKFILLILIKRNFLNN